MKTRNDSEHVAIFHNGTGAIWFKRSGEYRLLIIIRGKISMWFFPRHPFRHYFQYYLQHYRLQAPHPKFRAIRDGSDYVLSIGRYYFRLVHYPRS